MAGQVSKVWHVGHSKVVTLSAGILREAKISLGDILLVSSPSPGCVTLNRATFTDPTTQPIKEAKNEGK